MRLARNLASWSRRKSGLRRARDHPGGGRPLRRAPRRGYRPRADHEPAAERRARRSSGRTNRNSSSAASDQVERVRSFVQRSVTDRLACFRGAAAGVADDGTLQSCELGPRRARRSERARGRPRRGGAVVAHQVPARWSGDGALWRGPRQPGHSTSTAFTTAQVTRRGGGAVTTSARCFPDAHRPARG
jgi:hypothetical protein